MKKQSNRLGVKECAVVINTIRKFEFGGSLTPVLQASAKLKVTLGIDKDKVYRYARVFGYNVHKSDGEWIEK